jgi:3-hydroxyisobutyrate dehydrogenase-like beta-hydroxyacid dehydrogenase
MGAALVRALASAGYSVAAWNRTPDKAKALEGEGVRAVASVADAVRDCELVIACTNNYETTYTSLDAVQDWTETTLINLATGAPEQAIEMAEWARVRGVDYLDGNVTCYPDDVGTETALFFYAGSGDVWERCQPVISAFGGHQVLAGSDIAAANVLQMGGSMFYLPAIVACVEMATYLHSQNVALGSIQLMMRMLLDNIAHGVDEIYTSLASGDHETDQANIDNYGEGEAL